MRTLVFTERNSWEGETWEVYCVAGSDEEALVLADFVRACETAGRALPGSYKAELADMSQEQIDERLACAQEGYFDSVMQFELTPEVIESIECATKVIQEGDQEKIDNRLYKLALFR